MGNATIFYWRSPELAAKSIQIKSQSCCVHQETAKELIHLRICSPGMPKLNINSLHEDEDVLHYNQIMCSHARQPRHLLNRDWRSSHLENQTASFWPNNTRMVFFHCTHQEPILKMWWIALTVKLLLLARKVQPWTFKLFFLLFVFFSSCLINTHRAKLLQWVLSKPFLLPLQLKFRVCYLIILVNEQILEYKNIFLL